MKFTKLAIPAILTALLVSFALGTAAHAGGEKSKAEDMQKPAFEELDANIDGVISKEEARDTWLAENFSRVDADGNGQINRSEYEKAIS